MLEVSVERTGTKPVFEVGELVELDKSQHGDGGGYLVLVTKAPSHTSATLFGGVVVQCDKDDNDIFVGDHSNNFSRHAFTKFVGRLTMVSS